MMIENLFLGAGAMKAGTTWVYKAIEKHPDIYFSYEKEIHYFAHSDLEMTPLSLKQRYARFQDMMRHTNPDHLNALALRRKLIWYAGYLSDPIDDSWYLNLFAMRARQKYCADFSNLYCHLDDNGWRHVKNIAKNVKVIYILRHPWKRLWSHVRFHAAIIGEFDKLPTWNKKQLWNFATSQHMWINTEYTRCVKSLKRNLAEDEVRVFFFEDIHADHDKWLGELEEFLGIKPFAYDQHLLNKKINVSGNLPMPGYFHEMFKDEFEREIDELEGLGLKVPESWKGQ